MVHKHPQCLIQAIPGFCVIVASGWFELSVSIIELKAAEVGPILTVSTRTSRLPAFTLEAELWSGNDRSADVWGGFFNP